MAFDILYTVLSLAFVIVLLYGTVFLLKKMQEKQTLFFAKLNKKGILDQKINIKETRYLDSKTKIVVIEYEKFKYLVLISDKGVTVIDKLDIT
jgi:flagellar biogenesis protein FliO